MHPVILDAGDYLHKWIKTSLKSAGVREQVAGLLPADPLQLRCLHFCRHPLRRYHDVTFLFQCAEFERLLLLAFALLFLLPRRFVCLDSLLLPTISVKDERGRRHEQNPRIAPKKILSS